MAEGLHVVVWNEGRHEKTNPTVKELYPEGMGRVIAAHLREQPGIASVEVGELDDPDQGLPAERLAKADVMTWWGHMAHHEVDDALVEKVVQRVWDGMGLIVLHSGHFSKPFRALMGTQCDLRWRDDGERERLWVTDPAHPIADGIPETFTLEHTEMYGEFFDIPQPDELVFISWFEGGEVFRSGCCWHRGRGRIFYFRPGHETFPIFYDETVMKVITNGVRWAAPSVAYPSITRGRIDEPLEPIRALAK